MDTSTSFFCKLEACKAEREKEKAQSAEAGKSRKRFPEPLPKMFARRSQVSAGLYSKPLAFLLARTDLYSSALCLPEHTGDLVGFQSQWPS